MNQEQRIAEYLADEEKLYQDWFIAVSQPQSRETTIPVGVRDSLTELKQRAKTWFQQNQNILKGIVCQRRSDTDQKTLCERWRAVRQVEHFHVKQEIIVALTVDITLAPLFHPYHTVVVITVLAVNRYLDILCQECPDK